MKRKVLKAVITLLAAVFLGIALSGCGGGGGGGGVSGTLSGSGK